MEDLILLKWSSRAQFQKTVKFGGQNMGFAIIIWWYVNNMHANKLYILSNGDSLFNSKHKIKLYINNLMIRDVGTYVEIG